MQEIIKGLKYLLFGCVMSFASEWKTQQHLTLHIKQPEMPWHLSDSVVLEVWKYYLCDLSCGKSISDDCILIDSDTIVQMECDSELPDVVKFRIGVDSIRQERPNFSGDLNPLKNMYWTWQSGYIQLKAEGMILKPNGIWESFQLHLGGFRRHRCDRAIELFVHGENVELIWNEKALSRILQLIPKPKIMSECFEASFMMSQIAQCIQIR